MTIKQALTIAAHQLASVTDQPLLEAEILLAKTLNKARSYCHAWPDIELNEAQQQEFNLFISRRCSNEPIAYITGEREFWSLDFVVTKDTLIPRPETELLIETLLVMHAPQTVLKIADLGTGSGVIGLTLAHERPNWEVCVTDRYAETLEVARMNAQRLGLQNVNFFLGNWCEALTENNFDVIVSNPPYISETEWHQYAKGLAFEPRHALVSGMEGLDAIQIIADTAKAYLKPNGLIMIEHGFLQAVAVRQILTTQGYKQIHSIRDLSNHERLTVGQF